MTDRKEIEGSGLYNSLHAGAEIETQLKGTETIPPTHMPTVSSCLTPTKGDGNIDVFLLLFSAVLV